VFFFILLFFFEPRGRLVFFPCFSGVFSCFSFSHLLDFFFFLDVGPPPRADESCGPSSGYMAFPFSFSFNVLFKVGFFVV